MKISVFYKSLIIILVAVIFCQCGAGPGIQSGKDAFEAKKYMTAVELLQQEYDEAESDSAKAQIAYLLGESYYRTNQVNQAAMNYFDAFNLGYGPDALFKYAQMLKGLEKYELAIEQFRTFINQVPSQDAKAEKEIAGAEMALKWEGGRSKYTIFKMPQLNSPVIDYAPTFYENKDLIISSDREESEGSEIYGWTGNKFSDLYLSKLTNNDNYAPPVPFSDMVNTKDNEGTVAFNSDYTEMYFTRCVSDEGEGKNAYCDIYISHRKDNGEWGDAEMINFFDDSVNVGHPALTEDNNTMIFSSDAPGGFGGKDLYMATRSDNGWGVPVNMGETINTNGDEVFPFIHKNGKLYFSSDGHVGLGGLDVFMVEGKNGSWSAKPTNLHQPINSGSDDFGITFDEYEVLNKSGFFESVGFFSSSRPGGIGADDVYKFIVELPAHFTLQGTVLRKVFEDPENPNSKVVDYEPLPNAMVDLYIFDKESGLQTVVDTATANEDGYFEFQLMPDNDYRVISFKPGYFTKPEFVSTKGIKGTKNFAVALTVELIMDKVYKERQIVLNNIYYDFDSWYIRKDAAKVLDTLVSLLKENPNIKVEIGSHTDSKGSYAYNERLSQRRAESVVRYLASKGISRRRLVAKGYGESMLVNNCRDGVECTDEQHQRNRRTTFKVLSDDFVIESVEPDKIDNVDPATNFPEKRDQEEDQ